MDAGADRIVGARQELAEPLGEDVGQRLQGQGVARVVVGEQLSLQLQQPGPAVGALEPLRRGRARIGGRSEEHTSELQSLMRTSYAVFCLKKKKNENINRLVSLYI